MLMQEETAHEIRASELAVLPSSPVANPPSEDGGHSLGVISPSVAPDMHGDRNLLSSLNCPLEWVFCVCSAPVRVQCR